MVRRLRPRRVVPAGDDGQEGGLRPEQDVVFRRKNTLVHVPRSAASMASDGVSASRRWRMSSRGCPPPTPSPRRVDGVYSARRTLWRATRRRSAPARWRKKQSFGHRRRFSAAPLLRRWLCAVEVQQSAVPTTNDQVVDAVAVEIGQAGRRGLVHGQRERTFQQLPNQILQRRRPEERRPC